MKIRLILFLAALVISVLYFSPKVNAQMMGSSDNPSVNPTEIQNQQQEETAGKKLFDQLQNNQLTCQKLTDDNFEKIGEYAMGQMFGGNTAVHIAMNERIKKMRGVAGEEQMHIQIGKSSTDCIASSQNNATRGGISNMMGWNVGFNGMMNGSFGWFSIVALFGWIVVLIDLILAGIWLWQQINKNKRK